MQIKCEYCGSMIDDNLEKCPNCGATNENMNRAADKTPKTIEELKAWYAARNLPPYEKTRFFIGINYTQPKAFGIYEENGEFIVYKNKADGSRAIRYKGTDEDYAVNELFLKLKSEILNQKSSSTGVGYNSSSQGGKKSDKKVLGVLAIIMVVLAALIRFHLLKNLIYAVFIAVILTGIITYIFDRFINRGRKKKPSGSWSIWCFLGILVLSFLLLARYDTPKYYNYNDNVYVEYHGDYFEYDGYNDYYSINSLPVEIYNNPADYEYNWFSNDWDSDVSFKESDYYEDNYSFSSSDSWSSGSDSSYDWNSGSDWDSGSSDWGSDW